MIELSEDERIDDLQRRGYKIIQNKNKFCFGMDAVLLSDFAKIRRNDRVVDFGTGTGIIPLLLHARMQNAHYTGLEIQAEMAKMARRSVELNGLNDDIDIIEQDLKLVKERYDQGSFEVVVSNPPYMRNNSGFVNPDDSKAISRHEIAASLDDIITNAAYLLHENGRFYMVHRPFRLGEIISKMVSARLEPKRMRLVYPYVDKEPNMVLIEGIKGAGSEIKVESPLIVYEASGDYTEEIKKIYGA